MAATGLAAQGRVLVVAGPTAVGKTALSLRVASALAGGADVTHGQSRGAGSGRALSGTEATDGRGEAVAVAAEVVSGDSVQIYRGLDIGTDKATAAARRATPHHLVDRLGFQDSYSAHDFAALARQAIREIHGRGHVPMVVGGSGFYLATLLQGPRDTPRADPTVVDAVRQQLRTDASWATSLARLAAVDPTYAATLSVNDYYRLERGLALAHMTQGPLSPARRARKEQDHADFRCVFLTSQRVPLMRRIDLRCEQMVQRGLVEEVARLRQQGLHLLCPAGRAIGYRQTLEYLLLLERRRQASAPSPLEKRAMFLDYLGGLQQTSRHYARRQWIWFRREPDFVWIDAGQDGDGAVVDLLTMPRSDYERRVRLSAAKRGREHFDGGPDEDAGDDHPALAMRTYRSALSVFHDPAAVDAMVERIERCVAPSVLTET